MMVTGTSPPCRKDYRSPRIELQYKTISKSPRCLELPGSGAHTGAPGLYEFIALEEDMIVCWWTSHSRRVI